MHLFFLHHQQRRPYTEEPGYNELFRPLIRARQVTGWTEFVYQTPLRQLLLAELAKRGKTPNGSDPSRFIADNFERAVFEEATFSLLPELLGHINRARPDLIIYSMTWPTEMLHPAGFTVIKDHFPAVKILAQLWDHGEGGALFGGYEKALLSVIDFYANSESLSRVRRIKARQPPYDAYEHVERVHWLPTVFDPELYRPAPPGTPQDSDVAVLGSSEGHRREIIALLRQRYGARFRHLGGHMAEDRFVTIEDYVAAIQRTKIIVNTQTYLHRQQVKGRVREVLSCAGFLLEEDNPESCEFLEGSGTILFRDSTDLLEKIDYFLEHEAERQNLAARGHDWYRGHFSPDLAMQQIMAALGRT